MSVYSQNCLQPLLSSCDYADTCDWFMGIATLQTTLQTNWPRSVYRPDAKTLLLFITIHPPDEALMNFTGSPGSCCHGNSEELHVVRHHLRCLTFWWHSSVTGGGGRSEGVRKEEGEVEVRKTRQPLGCQHRPNDGCQLCTQVKLKGLRWQKKRREVCL